MILVNDENREKYIEFLQKHKKGHFLQSPEWAKVKSDWKNEVVLVEDETTIGSNVLSDPKSIAGF